MMKCEMMIKIMNIEADGEYEGMEAKKWCEVMAKKWWSGDGMEAKNGGKLSKWGKKKWNIKFL